MENKCPKNNKHCRQAYIIHKGKDYSCSGITSKPTKYEKDNIKLCLNGTISKATIEMTSEEAADIILLLQKAFWKNE